MPSIDSAKDYYFVLEQNNSLTDDMKTLMNKSIYLITKG